MSDEAALARDAAAGHRIVDTVVRAVAGKQAVFHAYQPDSWVAWTPKTDLGGGWVGEFTVAGKRVRITMEVRT